MKTTDFINKYQESAVDNAEYNDEAGMVKNSLHTIIRVATHLERELGDNENMPEWVEEKIAIVKANMVTVMDYMISQHEMGQQEQLPGFDPIIAESQFNEAVGHSKAQRAAIAIAKKKEKRVAEGLGYSQDPAQAKWYHEGRKAFKYGTTAPSGLIQDIAKKHGCPPEWLKAFHAGYQDQEGWGKEGVAEGLHPMVIDDIKKLATLNPADRYSAYGNIRGYFKDNPELSKMASALQGGYYEADMLRGKYKTAAAKAKYDELEPMHQAFIKQALGQEQGVAEGSMDDNSIWSQYGHYSVGDLQSEFPNLSPKDAQTIVNYAEYGWTNVPNRQEYRNEVVKRVKIAMGQQGVAEGTIYDMDKEYGAPAAGKKPMPHGGSIPRRHDDDPDFMDPDQRRLRADQARVKKAQDEYHAKKKQGVTEDAGATGSSSVAVSMQSLGEKGDFSKKAVNKKLGGYTNMLTRGGPVKLKAPK